MYSDLTSGEISKERKGGVFLVLLAGMNGTTNIWMVDSGVWGSNKWFA